MTQKVSIWGIFPDHSRAVQALTLLESGGFGLSEIAIEKQFKRALAGFDWSEAIYVRLPEGIVAGFAGGGLLAALIGCIVARGIPPMFPLIALTCLGCVAGAIVGAFAGMIVARLESSQDLPADDPISIGVLCLDLASEDRAKGVFRVAGAAAIDTQSRES
jgi:hypothetical protein